MEYLLERTTERLGQDKDEGNDTIFNEKKWEWSFLRKKCQNLELEPFFETYLQRLRSSYLSLFIVIQCFIVFMHCLLLLTTISNRDVIYLDVGVYVISSMIVWLVLSINFHAKLIKRHSWIMYLCSWLAISTLVIADIGVILYHEIVDHVDLRPSYPCYILYAVYIFMPLPEDVHAIILGIAVTVSYMISFGYITYRGHSLATDNRIGMSELISEAVFLLCTNMLGLFTRLTKEIAIRTTFLDRRQCVEENLLLRYARDQEKSLLLSILPAQIANKIEQDVKLRIERLKRQAPEDRDSLLESRIPRAHYVLDHYITKNFIPWQMPNFIMSVPKKRNFLFTKNVIIYCHYSRKPSTIKRWRQPDTEKLFIEPHNDVTILYADVVNYTYLTTTLDVKTLVETIHDLFVKFDTASQRFNVLRIKFLGDCYYCVSGVPIPNEYHAKCCVDLGLCMIRDIRDVRIKRKLNIDMRIGVHSGNILSGVIGARKWQYDIWSKDVDIANRLESTGVAGRVHVSEQTLKLLDGEYLYEEGTAAARADEVLRKYQIHTFLIKPPRSSLDTQRTSTGAVRRQIETRFKDGLPSTFMQNTIVQYSQIRTQATLEMNREMDKMPISRIQVLKMCFGRSKRLTQDEMEEQSFRSNITSVLLFFKDWRWEVRYMNEPDAMFKYSILFGFLTFLCIVIMQAVIIEQSKLFWMLMGGSTFVFIICIAIAWYRKLWIMLVGETDASIPTQKVSLILFRFSEGLQKNVIARISIYVLMVLIQCGAALLQLIDCNRNMAENDDIDLHIYEERPYKYICFYPWSVTNGLVLIICITFVFTRTLFVLKLFLAIFIVVVYALIVAFDYDFIYERSESTNVDLLSEFAHMMVLVITLIIFHLMDRQTEFISKVDYNWKRQLQKKQDDAKFTNETIKILINNILPSHVADIYMTKQMQNELYYEEYENVAVMFATIRNYDTENVGLRVLNEIICDFDEVLGSYKGPLKIEKIKVAGWTYMAACGLDVERSENVAAQVSYRNSSLLPNGRRSQHSGANRNSQQSILSSESSNMSYKSAGSLPKHQSETSTARYEGHSDSKNMRSRKISSPQHSNVVYVMAQFALDLMRTLRTFNTENLQVDENDRDRGMLRIGISNGEIMAGVVGSYKPHYDIWGNAVNMASRMDSTGLPGTIQVTENTANILESFGIQCYYRGMTFVKGRGKTPTYFVGIDDNLDFIRKDDNKPNDHNP